jgi:titin
MCVTGQLACSIVGLTNNTTYSIAVRATNGVGTGPASNALSATPGVAPSSPRSLATSPNLAAGVGLTWQAPASSGSLPVTGYRIYRGPAGDTAILLTAVGAVTSYTDTTVVNGGQYVYQVAALNGFAEGPRSTEVSAQRGTAPTAPQAVSGSVSGQGITVRWSSPASNGGSPVTGYRVYRGTTSGGETLLAGVGAGTSSYVDKAVGKKTRYFYRITALNVLGESVPSGEVMLVSR